MIRFENTIEINQPVDVVFEFIADFENIPKWNYFVKRVKKTSPGNIGERTTYYQVRQSDEQSFMITDYIPNTLIAIKTIQGASPRFTRRFTFEATPEGSTRLIDLWELQTERAQLLERLAAFNIKTAVHANLGKLKELLETGETHLQDGRTITFA